MNKKLLKYCKIVMAFMLLLCSIGAYADDIKFVTIDGIKYLYTSRGYPAYVTTSPDAKGYVVIPESIVINGDTYEVWGLGSRSFEGCTSLKGVTLSSRITDIPSCCFKGCTSLTNVTIPSSVTSLGYSCFEGCTSLTSVTIPSSVTSLGSSCFKDCTNLTDIPLPDGFTYLPGGYLSGCTSLTNVTIPSSVTSLGYSCFEGCTGLMNVTIPSSVTSLGSSCFKGCTNLTDVPLPDGFTYLPDGYLSGCTSLTNVTIPNSIASLGKDCFNSCKNLTNIILPSSITSLEDGCFAFCANLTNITLPSSITSLGRDCFNGCKSLTNITLPNSITSLGGYCFQACTGLTSVTIPNSVTSLGIACFRYCTNLNNVTILSSATSLGKECFRYCTNLNNVTIPGSVSSFGAFCFAGCTSLVNITIPDGVISLGERCFEGASLSGIIIPGSAKILGEYCFAECKGLDEIEFSEGVEKIPNNFCYGCSNLDNIIIPSTVTQIGNKAFEGASFSVVTYLPVEWRIWDKFPFGEGSRIFVSQEIYDNIVGGSHDNSYNNSFLFIGIPVRSVSLPFEMKIERGERIKIPCEIIPENATEKVLKWSVKDSNVATVDQDGVVTALKNGKTVVYAETTDVSLRKGRTFIDVTNVKVKNIELPKEKEMYVGEKWSVEYTVLPDAAENKAVSYSVDNEDVVNVYYDSSNKLIAQAKKLGTANITLTSKDGSDISATCKITVKLAELNLSTKTVNLQQGGTYAEQKITTNISGVGTENVIWSSTDPNVASIDANGMITAKKPGIATIRYVFKDDKSVYADCKVIVYATSVAYIGGICYLLDKNKMEATVTNVYGGDNTSVDAQKVAQCYSGDVNIPAATYYDGKRYTVTKVGNYAFSRQNELHSVSLPSTVTSIQGYAFYKCSSLDNFDMPNTVQSLGGYAFAGCASLTDIHLSTSLGSIGQYSFSECGLKQITLPESLKGISTSAFRNNEHLQKVQLSESMESIGAYAFCDNAGLKEISFPKKLQSIGISAFENNPALESVTFNTEVENMSIGKNAFNQCPILNKVYISNLNHFAQISFGNAKANPANTSQHIYDVSGKEIKNVVLTSGIRFINDNAFNGCAYIESVEIASTLEYIKDNIFKGCSNLKDVYCYATEVPPFAGSQDPSEMDDVFKAATLHVVYGNEKAYEKDYWWGRFSQVVGCNTPIPDPVKVESITLNQTEATLAPDGSIQLTALVNPDNADNKNVNWSSSNEDVAMVTSDGLVLAMADGTADIIAEAADGSGVKAICKLTVKGTDVKLTNISFANTDVSIEEGSSIVLGVNFYPENATNKQLTWTSARPAVATVNDKGEVKALTEGKTIITAKTTDGSNLTIRCVVTVTQATSIGNITMGDVKIILDKRHLKVEGLADNDIVQIVNTIGFTVYKGTEHEVDLDAPGIYIIKVKGKTLKFSVK